MFIRFKSRTIVDPDGEVHHNPGRVVSYSYNLSRKHEYFMWPLGMMLAILAAVFAARQLQFEKRAYTATASVVRVESRIDNSTQKGSKTKITRYREIMSYRDGQGRRYEIAENSWSSAMPSLGQTQAVMYDPSNPANAVISRVRSREPGRDKDF
jgi:Protein of unknown function (DUF3592)